MATPSNLFDSLPDAGSPEQAALQMAPKTAQQVAPVKQQPQTLFDALPNAGDTPPQESGEGPSLLARAGDLFTGKLRETPVTKALPELGEWLGGDSFRGALGPDVRYADKLKAATGLLTTFDPERQQAILKEVDPSLDFRADEKGNMILSRNGHEFAVLNKPGISQIDLMRMGAQAGIFSKAASAQVLGNTIKAKGAIVGAASGVTQALQDLFNQAMGGTEDVKASNIDKGEVAAATLGGAGFEWGAGLLAKAAPKLFSKGGVDVDLAQAKIKLIGEAKIRGIDPKLITDDFVAKSVAAAKKATGNADDAGAPLAQAVKDADEFNISYTQGQRTGDKALLSREDSMRHGGLGDRPMQTMTTFADDVQAPEIADAVHKTQKSLGGEAIERIDDVGELGDVIRSESDALLQRVDDAYSAVGEATLAPESFNKLLTATRKAVIGQGNDRTLPETAKFLGKLKSTQKLLNLTAKGKKLEVSDIPLKQIENLRRQLGTHIASAEKTDKRQLTLMKKQFDTFMDDAVVKGLFDGDTAALDGLKNARALRTEYAKKFQAQPKRTKSGRIVSDQAGDFIEKIVAANPTSQEISNALFGAGATFGKTTGVKLANRMKDIAGDEGWNTIRQAAFRKIAQIPAGQGEVSGQKMLSSLDKAMKDHGATDGLMRTLFTDQEIAKMYRLANAVKRARPPKENASGTAYKGSQLVQQAWQGLSTALGVGTANPIPIVLHGAVKLAGSGRKASAANAAIRPLQAAAKQTRPQVVSQGPAAAVALTTPSSRNEP